MITNVFTAHTTIYSAEVNENFAELSASGVIQMYGGSSAPTGWLLCDGSEVSQATYSNLYATIGTAFNTGGETAGNFRLPDFKGRSATGFDTGQSEFNSIGRQGGAKTVNLAHSHANQSHRHYGYANGGDLRATIGASTGDSYRINYIAIGAVNPNTGSAVGNGTYAVKGSDVNGNLGFSHYTPVYGYTSTPGEWGTPETKLSSTQGILSPYLVVNFIIKI